MKLGTLVHKNLQYMLMKWELRQGHMEPELKAPEVQKIETKLQKNISKRLHAENTKETFNLRGLHS